MPSKEECKRALEYLQNPTDIESKWYSVDILNEVIDEHFKLIEPYKLEDLKPNMWVYDIKYDEFCRIDFIAGIYPHRSYSDGTCEDGVFEENRFYPVQYANEVINNES